MLSLETRINGNLISCVYIRNVDYIDNKNCIYNVDYHQFGKKPSLINFKIQHNREENVEKLMLLVYEEIQKRLKSKSNSENK